MRKSIERYGFSMKLINPIYKKELKQTARMKRTAVLLLLFNAALASFGLFAYYVSFNSKKEYMTFIHYSDILTIYIIMTAIESIMILLVIPAVTASSIAGEREKQTLDILMTTGISEKRIVNGKLLSSISTMLLLIFSSLPVISIVFSIGGISFYGMAEYMLFLIITSIYIGSIGILFSSTCKRTVTAVVCSYVVMFLLVIGMSLLYFGAALMHNSSYFGSWEYSSMLWYSSKLGKFTYLLFLNPLVSYLSIIKEQMGFFAEIKDGISASGSIPLSISKNWFIISMVLQLLISVLLLHLSALKLYSKSIKNTIINII